MFARPEHVLDYLHAKLVTNQVALGLKFVGYGEDFLIPEYPAVVLTADPVSRELHATQQFRVFFTCTLWVYHARMDESHKVRTQNDLALATDLVELLHDDYTLSQNIIFGYISAEDPGIVTRPNKEMVVGTRITWVGENVIPFTAS